MCTVQDSWSELLSVVFFASWREEADKQGRQLWKQTSNTTLGTFKTSSVFQPLLAYVYS